ncbi:efflux RND transporter periplasmic adaptor subunit [Azonexus sp.]|jgi:membrane fusion protein (multidrug efflux system)|uniref:efflux RND transporter periplasmic adaptor subunit n=1 Tax=Azonexus sp. TaxID=1872668 RepID=UPI00283A902B|nr:efflux RND transporter periplasmic adaptor subunit [Azonexus sp.]
MRIEWISFRLISVTAVAVMLSACGEKPAPPPPPTPEVGVVTVQPTAVPVVSELSGRTSAYLVAQVRARVDGVVLRREFTEGSLVKAGQRLYKIDSAPYVAALHTARAVLAKAKANLATQDALIARYKVLVAANAVSKQDYDNAIAAQGQAAADVAAGEAAVETAQINLGYTNVVAPVAGQVGISQVTPGAYVQAGAATLMATVQQLDPMYVDVTQSSLDGLRLRREIQEGRLMTDGPNAAKVTLILEDGRTYTEKGKLQFTDVTVDQTTGSVTVRALFPNADRVLLPGMFVRARIEEGINNNAFLVPQIGVQHDQKGQATVLVVDKDDKVELRTIQISGTQGQDWVVLGGLNVDDRVIVQGVEKVKPGTPVKAVAAQLPPPPPPGAPSVDMATGSASTAAKASPEPKASPAAEAHPASGSAR